jgi:hypothetical protein
MELGFETIGHATVIAHDRGPVLATDPWFDGDAYFGSWTLSHDVPPGQLESIRAATYCWVSHGHPDHLSVASLRQLRSSTLLLPDHVGKRIETWLRHEGFTVRVLRDREWVELSDRIRVCCIADYNQDAILLIDVGGRLVLDINDAAERGWRRFVRETTRRYDVSFLLKLASFGDPDMINLFDPSGDRIQPRAALREPPGRTLAQTAGALGARYVVPFSTMHRYQRTDSAWANEHVTTIHDYDAGFESATSELLPAYVRYDCLTDEVTAIDPPERVAPLLEPEVFGDHWDEPLDDTDVATLTDYFRSISHLADAFDFVAFDVGGREHVVTLRGSPRRTRSRGFTFHAPRASLMSAVRGAVFDDLLIGNFARTTVHGPRDREALYPDFTPYVCKYADNGEARSHDELREYFRAYRRRAPYDYLRHRLEREAVDRVRSMVPRGSRPYEVARKAYRALTSPRR